jgi:hypothetical protein
MKYKVELAMTGIGNCWCQKPQLTDIPCNHLLAILFIQEAGLHSVR